MSSSPSRGTNRRTLLAAGAAAATTTAVSGAVSSRASATEQPYRKAKAHGDAELRIGLVGCGGRGTGAASQALRAPGRTRLVAMGDAFSDRLESSLGNLKKQEKLQDRIDVADDHKFTGFDAFQKVIDSDVDVVILATPPHFRPDQFAYAIEKGKHVFMEKPVGVDGAGIRKVLAADEIAQKKGLTVGVGLQRHHQANYRALMQRVHDGAIGDIVAARCYWNMGALWHKKQQENWSGTEWQLRNWLYFTWLSGDHITEQHVHNLDVVNWAKQAHPVKALGLGGRQVRVGKEFGHIYDHHAVEYEYADGSRLFSQCRQIAGCHNRVSEHLIGTNGTADMGGGQGFKITGPNEWRWREKNNNPYQTEHDDLFQAIRDGKPYSEAKYGAHSTLTAIMGRMATYTGKEITWEQALASERLGPSQYDMGADLAVDPVPMPGR